MKPKNWLYKNQKKLIKTICFFVFIASILGLTGCKTFSCKEILARLPDAFNAGMQGYQNTDTQLRLNALETQNIANQK